tara:strand:- start:681 stop:1346 length:666 start_codon:yes stop_codon:yes gene_type:complete
MSKPKQIVWTSWNARVDEMMAPLDETFTPEMDPDDVAYNDIEIPQELLSPELFLQQERILYTPMGPYPEESLMKPSDRWDCWLGYTNFSITNEIEEEIGGDNAGTKEGVEGVEALRVLGRYTFFVGVGKLFEIREVRENIEKKLCVYTEQEILSNEETQTTVNLVKSQLKTKKYWSMLVSPGGDVDYIVSDKLDRIYLEGLNGLLERKQNIGGIILRGNDG